MRRQLDDRLVPSRRTQHVAPDLHPVHATAVVRGGPPVQQCELLQLQRGHAKHVDREEKPLPRSIWQRSDGGLDEHDPTRLVRTPRRREDVRVHRLPRVRALDRDRVAELLLDRGISFENVVVSVEAGGLLDILEHPNQVRYPGQRILVVTWDGYVYLVPFVEESDHYFLKTVIPSRKATRTYLCLLYTSRCV